MNRRRFLLQSIGTTLALPGLPSLMASPAANSALKVSKGAGMGARRFVAIGNLLGFQTKQLFPATAGRNYEKTTRPSVREFYRINHEFQTYDFVREKQREYGARNRKQMSIWEAMEFLNTLVDDSDPDTDLSQIQHLLQTSEAIRADGHPRWFVLTGLIHDLDGGGAGHSGGAHQEL